MTSSKPELSPGSNHPLQQPTVDHASSPLDPHSSLHAHFSDSNEKETPNPDRNPSHHWSESTSASSVKTVASGNGRPFSDGHETLQQVENLKQTLEDKLGDSHVNLLPLRQLILCLVITSLCLFVSFCDQNGVTVALAYIGKDLHAENSINWAGTASLLANTVCQVFFGRFADIFGRREVLMGSLFFLFVASLCCGFAQNGPTFFFLRALAGIGSGGVTSMAMVIVSDVVTLKQRGKFQGILGTSIGVAGGISPIIMGAFAEKSTWRNFYRFLPPLIVVVIVLVYFYIPHTKKVDSPMSSMKEKFKRLDFIGFFFSTACLVFLLVPISGGGSTFPWDSALVISMFVVGGLCGIAFLVVEATIPELPMIPLSIFKSPTLSLLLGSTFLFGMDYFSLMFMLPYYLQLVQGHSIMRSAVMLLPLVFTQAFMSSLGGLIITLTGHYLPIMISGYGLWLTGNGMTLAWNEHTSDAMVMGTLFMTGIGVGFIFQPTMVAAQANSRKAQRAVVIGTRNVVRSMGGAIGIAIATLIISNILLREITTQEGQDNLPMSVLDTLRDHIYNRPDLHDLTASQLQTVRSMYMTAIRAYLYMRVPLIGICFLGSFFVKDNGLKCLDEVEVQQDKPEKA